MIRRYEHTGVVGQAQPVELVEDSADRLIKHPHQRRRELAGLVEVCKALHRFGRGVHRVVRRIHRHVKQKRPAVVLCTLQLRDRPVDDQVHHVPAVGEHLTPVVPEIVPGGIAFPAGHEPVKDVRVVIDAAVEEAEPVVETSLVRQAARRLTEVPLAGHQRLIPRVAQCFRQGLDIAAKAYRVVRCRDVARHAGLRRHEAGHQAGSRRRAKRCAAVPLGAAGPFSREPILGGGLQIVAAVVADIAETLIVGEHDHEVGARGIRHNGW